MNWIMIVGLAMTHLLAFVGGMCAIADTKLKRHWMRPPVPPVPPVPKMQIITGAG